MKSTTITISYTNEKGQIVIPSEYRKSLEIDRTVPLLFQLSGNIITITPVKSVITKISGEDSYIEVLKRTRGKWGKIRKVASMRKNLEINASKRRRGEW